MSREWTGKGSKSRVNNKQQYDDNWEKIFGDKQPKFKKKAKKSEKKWKKVKKSEKKHVH